MEHPTGTRVCFRCKQEKPLSEFYKSNVRYYQRECKSCTKVRKSRWYKTEVGKASSRRTKLKLRFGLTEKQYDELLKAQDGKCLICESDKSYLGHKLAIDHDHKTKQIRGLLCKACNVGLGNFKDNPILLIRAALYLLQRY